MPKKEEKTNDSLTSVWLGLEEKELPACHQVLCMPKRPRRAPVPTATTGAASSEAVPDAQNIAVKATCRWCKNWRAVSTVSWACRACAAANNVSAPPRDEQWTDSQRGAKGAIVRESIFSDHPNASAADLVGICNSRFKELLQLAAFGDVLPVKLKAYVTRRRALFTRGREARLSHAPALYRRSVFFLFFFPQEMFNLFFINRGFFCEDRPGGRIGRKRRKAKTRKTIAARSGVGRGLG